MYLSKTVNSSNFVEIMDVATECDADHLLDSATNCLLLKGDDDYYYSSTIVDEIVVCPWMDQKSPINY